MHGAPLATVDARPPAHELGHDTYGINALQKSLAVTAVGGEHEGALLNCVKRPCLDRFLTDARMRGARNESCTKSLNHLLLERSNANPVLIELEQVIVNGNDPTGPHRDLLDRDRVR